MNRSKRNATFSYWLVGAALFGVLIASPCLTFAAEQKVALVIGNSAYPSSRLRNPVNDAMAMADKLKSLGFDVILKTDAGQREMTRAFSEFGRKLVPGSISLFYFAGHGMQVRGKNFLIPVDAEIDNEASVRSEAVDVEQILDHLSSAKLSMVILDACRNNPFERRFRSGSGNGLAQIDAPTGTLLAYATAPGKVAADGAGSNGLYTTELLKALDLPGLKIEDVFKQVRVNVLKASNDQQIPWESSSLTSEFYFLPETKPVADDRKELQKAARVQAELQAALIEERRKREREAASVKAEMEKLRAELLKFRADATTGQAAMQAGGHPQTLTPLAANSTNPAPAPATGDWARRLALLNKAPENLTLSKAVAILLDISADSELSLLLVHEGDVKRKNWHNAYAMGTDSSGNLIWGGAYQLRTTADAAETALEKCANRTGDSCKIVIANGEFHEKNFVAIAQGLGRKDITEVRHAFLQSLTRGPAESRVGTTGAGGSSYIAPSMGFASIRE